jgi:hypothetical protein
MEKFSLYDDEPKTNVQTSTIQVEENELLITVDFSRETFGQMVEKVRQITETTPDNVEINIFILSGYEPHSDAGLFLEYVKSLARPFKFFFRGILHLEFLKLLSFLNVWVNEGSKLKYDPTRLNEFQTQLLSFPQVFRNFFQRYIDEYHKYKGLMYFDITELKTLGFNFQTY